MVDIWEGGLGWFKREEGPGWEVGWWWCRDCLCALREVIENDSETDIFILERTAAAMDWVEVIY